MPSEMTPDKITLAEFTDKIVTAARAVSIAYLRGAEAALASDPPDVKVARQLLSQALASLDPRGDR